MSTAVEADKDKLRTAVLAARARRSTEERTRAAEAIALHAASLPPLVRARRVAAYLSMSTEPGTGPLLRWCVERGVEVLVPVSSPDRTMAWVRWHPGRVEVGALGVPEPVGEPHPEGLGGCEVAVVPALAIDHVGHRLGRGAGYYDRALADFTGLVCALVFDEELVPAVPHLPHDRSVDLVIAPGGVFRPERD